MELPESEEYCERIRWGHIQIALLIADITGRPVFIIEPDSKDGETMRVFKPGFVDMFGIFPTQNHWKDAVVHFFF